MLISISIQIHFIQIIIWNRLPLSSFHVFQIADSEVIWWSMIASLLSAFHLNRGSASSRMCQRQYVVRFDNWKSLALTQHFATPLKEKDNIVSTAKKLMQKQPSKNDGATTARTRVERIIIALNTMFQSTQNETETEYTANVHWTRERECVCVSVWQFYVFCANILVMRWH